MRLAQTDDIVIENPIGASTMPSCPTQFLATNDIILTEGKTHWCFRPPYYTKYVGSRDAIVIICQKKMLALGDDTYIKK